MPIQLFSEIPKRSEGSLSQPQRPKQSTFSPTVLSVAHLKFIVLIGIPRSRSGLRKKAIHSRVSAAKRSRAGKVDEPSLGIGADQFYPNFIANIQSLSVNQHSFHVWFFYAHKRAMLGGAGDDGVE